MIARYSPDRTVRTRLFSVLALVVGVTAASANPGVNPLEGQPMLHGGTEAQQQLVQAIINGFARPGFAEIEIGLAPRDYRRPGTAWLYLTIFATDGVDFTLNRWQGDLLTGLYASEAIRLRWRRLSGSSLHVITPDGRQHFDSSSALFLRPGGVDPASEDQVRALIEESDRASTLTVKSVSFDHPLGKLAVKIEAEVPTADDLRGKVSQTIGEFAAPIVNPRSGLARVEGCYIVVRDARNRPLSATSLPGREWASSSWTSPALRPR